MPSMSLDGYIAKDDNTIGRLFDWLQNGEVEVATVDHRITFHLSADQRRVLERWIDGLGALVCGRTLFDFTGGWGGTHTMDVPVVVVTHQVPDGLGRGPPRSAVPLRHRRRRGRGGEGAGDRGTTAPWR